MTILPSQQTESKTDSRALIALYVTISFLSAGLLLVVQPMASRFLLPSFGGSAAVWNTALVFFQTGLLAGYLFAHLESRSWLGSRWVHVSIVGLPLFVLPFGLPGLAGGSWTVERPTIATLASLAVMVGAPYFAVSTMSPTIQRWFSQSNHSFASNPYPLYAASNAGSLIALLAYPTLIEPALDLGQQARWFTVGYVGLFALTGLAAFAPGKTPPKRSPREQSAATSWAERVKWTYRAFVPSLLLLGVTRHLSTDVAAFPLLWVVPLALYLATFVIAFSGRAGRVLGPAQRLLKLLLIPAVLALAGELTVAWLAILLPLAALILCSLVAHFGLYAGRPATDRLTSFYLWIATGGALGGVVGALIAPSLFDRVLEYPIGLVLAATLVGGFAGRPIRVRALALAAFAALAVAAFAGGEDVRSWLLLGAAGLIAYLFAWRPAVFTLLMLAVALVALSSDRANTELLAVRTFYGVYRVLDTGSAHLFMSGTTIHGVQAYTDQVLDPTPLAYFHPSGPAGAIMDFSLGDHPAEVAIVGLGAGSLAAYGRSGDTFVYIEIDPAVVDIATDAAFFDHLSQTPATVQVEIGDGRLELEKTRDQYDLLIIDAFSSDSIPVHLLTREAVALYVSKVRSGALVAFHISNRYLELQPVLGRIASDAGLGAAIWDYQPAEGTLGAAPSTWVVLASDATSLESLRRTGAWVDLDTDAPLWTDSYSDVLSVIEWK